MKRTLLATLISAASLTANAQTTQDSANHYVPTPENLQARQQFADRRFGVFLNW